MSTLEGIHLDDMAYWVFLYGLGASLYFRRYRLWLLWVGTSMQAFNLMLYSSCFLFKHHEQSITAFALGCYLFAFLLHAYWVVQKWRSIARQLPLSWDCVVDMIEWRLAEEFRRQGMDDNQAWTWVAERRQQLPFCPSKEGGHSLEESYQSILSKMNMLEQGAGWRSEAVSKIELQGKTLKELRRVRLQLTEVAMWVMVGVVLHWLR